MEGISYNPENSLPREIDKLPEFLGFVEVEELKELHSQIVAAMTSGDFEASRSLTDRYRHLAEEIINEEPGTDPYGVLQIALTVKVGLIKREGGRADLCDGCLDDAFTSAWNKGLEEVAGFIELAISDSYTRQTGI